MYTCSWAVQCTQDAQIVRTDLAAIGITLDIKPLPTAELYGHLARRGEPWDIAFTNWGADFPDPANTINTLFDPASPSNFGRFNGPAFTKRMRRAATLTGDRRLPSLRTPRRRPDQKQPTGRGLGQRHLPRILLRPRQLPDLPADLRDRPRHDLPSTLRASNVRSLLLGTQGEHFGLCLARFR